MNTEMLQMASLIMLALALVLNLTIPSHHPMCPDLAHKRMKTPRELLKYRKS